MDDYNKIIESLGIRYIKSRNIKIAKGITIDDYFDKENSILLINNGSIYYGPDNERLTEGDMLFIPGGKPVKLSFGIDTPKAISNEEFVLNKKKYLQNATAQEVNDFDVDGYSQVMFEAKVFDSVNFFSSLNLPAFAIKDADKVTELIRLIIEEDMEMRTGSGRIIKIGTEHLVIEIIRYLLDNRMFLEELVTNSTYFKDPRLIDLFAYVKANLNGDLSNKVLAKIANVSEDYVGQFFKMLTGTNPQDYIEYQRMEAAVNLLRTTKISIREVGKRAGYKDTAYFCRRFKMMFGIPAGKMRKRETLMNV